MEDRKSSKHQSVQQLRMLSVVASAVMTTTIKCTQIIPSARHLN